MRPRLRTHPDELAALVSRASESLALDQTFLEKDFWAMEVLRACTTEVQVGEAGPLTVIFKGGTSLSRCFDLIKRFSEDVDLLVQFPEASGNGAREKALKQVIANVGEHLALEEGQVHQFNSTRGVKRHARYTYPARATASASAAAALSEGVLLEMGTRGGTFPTEKHLIRSTIADYAVNELGDTEETWQEFQPFTVAVLAPERTMLEKLSALHDGASRAPDLTALDALRRGARHLYDIHCLLNDRGIRAALSEHGPAGVTQLCADIDAHSEAAGWSWTARPDTGYGHSPLLSNHPGREALSEGYAAAMKLVYGPKPSMEDCLGTIRSNADLL